MEDNNSLYNQLANTILEEKKIQEKKNSLIEKSLSFPESPKEVILANRLIEQGQGSQMKSYLIDPLNADNANGFRARPYLTLSYNTLRSMAKQTGLISAIISTRKEQVASYNSYSTEYVKPGWKIEKNIDNYFDDAEEYEEAKKLDKEEKEEVRKIISFIENCGIQKRLYHGDDFDSFLRKFCEDSLVLDQACFEITHSKFCTPYEFFMIDGATIRYASTDFEEEQEKVRGYAPYAVQLYQNSIYTYYYPWELCMAIRNPNTNYLYNGYSLSELELLVKIITYTLYGEAYTGKFFSQGSNPKGLFIAKGSTLSEDKLQEFRQAWMAQTATVSNAHKIPIISGADLEWIDMQHSNKDMEFANWLDYCARLIMCVYKIDPKELGYSFGSEGSVNYESSVQEKILYSKEKGLVPLLKFIENKINKYIIYPISRSKYKFKFTGVDNSDDLIENLDLKRVEKGVMTFGEYRAKHGLPTKVEEDDFLLNSTWIQYEQMKQGQQQQGGMGNSMMDRFGQFAQHFHNHNQEEEDNNSVFKDFVEENPFARDLDNYLVEKGWK